MRHLAALSMVIALWFATGCTATNQRASGPPKETAAAETTAPESCPNRAHVDVATQFPELEGTSASARLYGLVFGEYPLKAGHEIKIAWRMTGNGPLRLRAIGPQNQRISPQWGPEPHGSSNWSRPGDEWGSGFRFTRKGCWAVEATRGQATETVTVLVTG